MGLSGVLESNSCGVAVAALRGRGHHADGIVTFDAIDCIGCGCIQEYGAAGGGACTGG